MTTMPALHPNAALARRGMKEQDYNLNGPSSNGTMLYGDAIKAKNKSLIRKQNYDAAMIQTKQEEVDHNNRP